MDTIAFVHIPKCAGTSLVDVVSQIAPSWWHVPAGLYVKEYDAFIGNYETSIRSNKDRILEKNYELLFGHFTVRDINRALGKHKGIRFSTILRDPIDRMVSEYYYSISSAHNGANATRLLYPTFEDFVHYNPETEIMSRFLEEYRGESADSIASRVMNDFAFVGLTEMFNQSARGFADSLGKSLNIDVKKLNVTAVKERTISSELRDIITYRNARDVMLYSKLAGPVKKRLSC